MTSPDACDLCLRRTHLVAALAGRIERARHGRTALGGLLALGDDELVAVLGAREDHTLHVARERFDPEQALRAVRRAGLTALCRHADAYPPSLLDLDDSPAVLHVAGDPAALPSAGGAGAIALVGARRATAYGLDTAAALGRGLAAAGVTVVSGMALGVDSAAHAGALAGGGPTIAVLAGGADIPYPASKRSLYRRILAQGCVVSELPPGMRILRWAFPARNRIIAALASATVVVEARTRSGSLITAEIAADLGRAVGAVPGPVTGSRSSGANALLHDGAAVVRDARDAIGLAAGPVAPMRPTAPRDEPPARAAVGPRPTATAPAALDPELREALDAVEDGADTTDRLAAVLGGDVRRASVALARLELEGLLHRRHDGSYGLRVAT